MLHVIQSNRVETLRQAMVQFFQPASVFEPLQVLVPSHGVGVWLQQGLADHQGVATLLQTDFIGTYQWKLYARILRQVDAERYRQLNEQVPLAAQAMQGQIFSHLIGIHESPELDEKAGQSAKALEFLFEKLTHPDAMGVRRQLWGLSAQIARVFADYVVYRPQWLTRWGQGESIGLGAYFQRLQQASAEAGTAGREADELPPEWRQKEAIQMERWQRQLWRDLFADTFAQRQQVRAEFWAALASHDKAVFLRRDLPRQLVVFAPVKLPPGELEFLIRLSRYVEVLVLHHNPTPEYWADVVDERWLAEARLRWPALAAHRDSEHTLLTSFGKQARDVFAQLVELSDGQAGQWQDAFVPLPVPRAGQVPSLLHQLQAGVYALQNPDDHSLRWQPGDDSLRVHACHSAMRQLEVLREEILCWLDAEPDRQPGDILVLMPDLQRMAPLIRAVFQGSAEAQELPVDITGMVSPDAQVLWEGLAQGYRLLQGRFGADGLVDWLALPPVSRAYGLDRIGVQRVGALLREAGFYRGFDGEHLAQGLAPADRDDRCTFRHALDRLVLGMAMPVEAAFADRVACARVGRSDFELVAALERIFLDLQALREVLAQDAQAPRSVDDWLQVLREQLEARFAGERSAAAWGQVQQLLSQLREGLHSEDNRIEVRLPLPLLLDEISDRLQHQPPGSVPGGRVSFARLGTLRPLPYRLVVVLDLGVGHFPQRDVPSSFDLMQLMGGERYDRSRLSDDQGAFLDALLLAGQACWLFYTGFEGGQPERLQPAGPVQKLLEFLGRKLQPLDQTAERPLNLKAQQALLEQTVVVSHRQLPFEPENFQAAQHPHEQGRRPAMGAGLWLDVARHLREPQPVQPWYVAGILPEPLPGQQVLALEQVIRDVQQPNRPFLRQARIRRLEDIESFDPYEPLSLDGLDTYQLRAEFLSRGALPEVMLKTRMPAGLLAQPYADWMGDQLEALRARVEFWAAQWQKKQPDPITRHDLSIARFKLSVCVPEALAVPVWLRCSPARVQGKHLLRGWLEYLAWQALCPANGMDRCMVIVGHSDTIQYGPVSPAQARDWLADWLQLWQQMAVQPVVLPAELLAQNLKKLKKQAAAGPYSAQPLLDSWLGRGYRGNDQTPAHQDEGCSLHPDWQLILRGQDAAAALDAAVRAHVPRLYVPILDHHQILQEKNQAQKKDPAGDQAP